MITLAIDIGSSSIKAGLFRDRTPLRTVRHALITRAEGLQVEVPAETLRCALNDAIRDVLCDQPKPDILAFDTFSPGLIVMNRTGQIVAGAITHQDRRSVAEAHAIEQRFTAPHLLKTTGNRPFPGGIASTSLLWLKRHCPNTLAAGCRIGFVATLVLHHLTGQWKMDPANAAFMGLWDFRQRQWDKSLGRFLGVSHESLPEVVFADTVLGRTLPAISKKLGLSADTPVVGGLIDTSAALLATPLKIGQLVHNAGSTDVLALCLDRPHPSPEIISRPVGTGVHFPERWLAVSTIAASGSAVHWARQTLFADLKDDQFQALLVKQCRLLAKNLTLADSPEFTPYLAGDRTQIDAPAAMLTGLTLGTSREQIMQSLLAGLIKASRERFIRLSRIHRIERDVYLAGGAAPLARAMHANWPNKNLRFKQIRGDALMGLILLAEKIR